MKLLVVILNYKVTDLAIDCLRSLAPEIPTVPGMKVAICENGTGGTAEQQLLNAITEHNWSPWASVTAVSPNRGFTGGNNVIIRNAMSWPAPPEYFLLLNADTIVLPGALKALVAFMDAHPLAGIAGSQLEWQDGTAQGSPFRFQGIATELDRGLRLGLISRLLSRYNVSMPKANEACLVDWVAGASMIIRRDLIEAIGPLDEGLYTYFDDIDYCLNASRAGWQTWFVPDSRIVHLEGASTGVSAAGTKRRPQYWFEARRRFFLKNYGALYAAAADLALISGLALGNLRLRIQGKPNPDPEHMLLDSVRNSVFLTGFKVREVQNPALGGRRDSSGRDS